MHSRVLQQLAMMILGVTLLLPGMAPAADAVILIDQDRALAGNVTPGASPGFPVRSGNRAATGCRET